MKFNKKQKIIIFIAVGIIILMAIIPPWTQIINVKAGYSERPLGYNFIFLPPESIRNAGVEIDFVRLSLQWFIVVLVGGLIVYFSKDD